MLPGVNGKIEMRRKGPEKHDVGGLEASRPRARRPPEPAERRSNQRSARAFRGMRARPVKTGSGLMATSLTMRLPPSLS